ncbi:MAG: hypothetical protein H5T61_02315 [Thermoflexales bacterium]|nr:hypothetical protein [Thermoflexales bacterium]
MTVSPPHRPDPWRLVWRTATGNIPLAVCLFVLAFYLLLLAWIPQFSSGPATTDRWRVQTRFGPWTGAMYRMGLFSLAHSPVVLVLLSLLAFLLFLRTVELAEGLRSRFRDPDCRRHGWVGTFPLLASLGVLVLLAGLLIGHRWGWREEGLVGPEIAPSPGHGGRTPHQYLVGFGPSLTIRAADDAGRPLKLQQTARDEAQTELVLYLTPSAPERSFAIPESSLVVRVGGRGDLSARSPILVEIFRAPGGERVQEATVEGDSFSVTVDGVHLEISRQPYPILALVYDPGLWLKWMGLVLGAIGLVGWLILGGQSGRIPGLLLSGLTLLVAGLAGSSLGTRGALGALPFQLEATALWLVGLGVWLIRQKESQGQRVGEAPMR